MRKTPLNHSPPGSVPSYLGPAVTSSTYKMKSKTLTTGGWLGSPTILVKHIPLVWPPIKSHLQQRPQIYLSIWESPHNETGNQPQYLHGISPTNGWTLGKEKSMGRTKSLDSYIRKPRRLDIVAGSSLSGSQQ